MGVLRILDETGDTALAWDPTVEATVAEAEAVFDRMLAVRPMAFARPPGARPEDATLLRKFDPSAEEIIIVRALQGG